MAEIPDDKRYFRIGEVSKIIGVEPHVLRYWESEFPQIRPYRPGSNQRTYQRKDIEALLEIKRLLYEEKLTVKGAKMRLGKLGGRSPGREDALAEVREELLEILKILDRIG